MHVLLTLATQDSDVFILKSTVMIRMHVPKTPVTQRKDVLKLPLFVMMVMHVLITNATLKKDASLSLSKSQKLTNALSLLVTQKLV
jgi:hypothetical protein